MKKQPAGTAEAADLRVGFSFYEEDLTALRQLVAELRNRGARVKRTYLVRALAHFVPEDKIFAHAVARQRQEEAGKAGSSGETVENLAFNIPVADVDKFERVGDKLAEKKFRSGRSFLMRSLIHAPWDFDALARSVKRFQKEFPDPRTRAGRARRNA